MRELNFFALFSGLTILAAGTISAHMAVFTGQSFGSVFYWGVLAIISMLAAFEFFHAALAADVGKYSLLSRGMRGMGLDLVHILLAIGLIAVSIAVQSDSALLCGGRLGAGFPVAFLCDITSESPIGDWGKMSWGDRPNFVGGFLNFLFYAGMLWLIFYIIIPSLRQLIRTNRDTVSNTGLW